MLIHTYPLLHIQTTEICCLKGAAFFTQCPLLPKKRMEILRVDSWEAGWADSLLIRLYVSWIGVRNLQKGSGNFLNLAGNRVPPCLEDT